MHVTLERQSLDETKNTVRSHLCLVRNAIAADFTAGELVSSND